MNGKEYFFRLDALRACAVGGVLLQHFGYWIPIPLGLNLGSYGVQLFFLISGFLITGILKDSFAKKSVRKALWDFYARRFLRIVPIYYLAVFVYVITGMLGVEDSAPYWFYFVNWELFLQGHYLPGTHFWSLAVEEQFYLFWPLIVFFASRRFPVLLYSGFVFSGFVFFAWPALSMNQLPFGWTGLPTSAFSALAAGALLRHVYHRFSMKNWNGFFVLGVAVFLGVHLIPTSFWSPAFETVFEYHSLILLCFLMVGVLVRAETTLIDGFFRSRFIRFLGVISYGIYVWHMLAHHFWLFLKYSFGYHFPGKLDFGTGDFVASCVITLCFASLSWFVIEKPLLKMKRYFA